MPDACVRLRAVTEADLPNLVRWFNDLEVTQFTAMEAGIITMEHEREWFAKISSPNCLERHWMIEADGKAIGACALMPSTSDHQTTIGIVIGEKTAWNKGYGTTTVRELLRIGFEEMNLHRISLRVFANNIRGIRCYEKCGFRYEGTQRQARFKRGEWLDVVQMAILRGEWEAMPNREQTMGLFLFGNVRSLIMKT